MATDPRSLKGAIAGPGGPHDRHSVVLDTTHAVLLDHVEVCKVEPSRDGVRQEPVVAMLLSGRVNRSPDRAEVLFLFDIDGAAGIVTELLALAGRMDAVELAATIRDRLDRLDAEDVLRGPNE